MMNEPVRRTLASLLRHAESCSLACDADLLQRFVTMGDEEAFTLLVRRHGPMVLGVCRRVLHDEHAAEDAFQAVFLILARKAGSLREGAALSAWLHRVALRAAGRIRRDVRWRRVLESVPAPNAPTEPPDELQRRECLALFDEELERLPEFLRQPHILCCLEGFSQEEAAQRLGCTVASIKGRLQRGRASLKARLARRGLPGIAVPASAVCAIPMPLVKAATTVALTGNASPIILAAAAAWTASRFKLIAVVLVLLGLLGVGGHRFSTDPPVSERGSGGVIDRNAPRVAPIAYVPRSPEPAPRSPHPVLKPEKRYTVVIVPIKKHGDQHIVLPIVTVRVMVEMKKIHSSVTPSPGPSGTHNRSAS